MRNMYMYHPSLPLRLLTGTVQLAQIGSVAALRGFSESSLGPQCPATRTRTCFGSGQMDVRTTSLVALVAEAWSTDPNTELVHTYPKPRFRGPVHSSRCLFLPIQVQCSTLVTLCRALAFPCRAPLLCSPNMVSTNNEDYPPPSDSVHDAHERFQP